MSLSFEALGLNASIVEGLIKQNITTPTAIQAQAVPVILSHQDVIAQSYRKWKNFSFRCSFISKG